VKSEVSELRSPLPQPIFQARGAEPRVLLDPAPSSSFCPGPTQELQFSQLRSVRGSVHWCGGGNLPGVKDILVELQNIKENYKLS
jgi:hypothetical protein